MKANRRDSLILQLIIYAIIGVVVWGLGDSRGPLIFSAVLAYLCFPLVLRLEKSGMKREVATVLIFLAFVSPLVITLIVAVPSIASSMAEFVQAFPAKAAEALVRLEAFGQDWGFTIPIHRDEILALISQKIQLLSMDMLSSVSSFLKTSALSLSNAIVSLLNVILVPVFFFYVLNDFDGWKKSVSALVPISARPVWRRLTSKSNDIVGSYIRGQLIACLVLAVMYGLGLELVGLPFGWLVGGLTGFFSFIPYLGFSLGFVIALIIAIASGNGVTHVFLVALVMGIVQMLESFVITPKLVGEHVGLSPLEALIALIVCGNLFGFTGLLFAIPLGALFKEVFAEIHQSTL